ncbi:hypothetical protein [Archangium sp.]|uniref:hypothetical protein n=1 Tax=Archangium sp. TaxID=1872627 RepID=UPI002D23A28C|nr:hypothetical protein [Archangium sp.]HYO54136.1 hypothetical protein [Archangium sp.]
MEPQLSKPGFSGYGDLILFQKTIDFPFITQLPCWVQQKCSVIFTGVKSALFPGTCNSPHFQSASLSASAPQLSHVPGKLNVHQSNTIKWEFGEAVALALPALPHPRVDEARHGSSSLLRGGPFPPESLVVLPHPPGHVAELLGMEAVQPLPACTGLFPPTQQVEQRPPP